MGRKRQRRLDLPERVYFHHGAYYFVHATGRWERLGNDYAKAMAQWAALINQPVDARTVGEVLDRYTLEVVPLKAERTQKDNLNEIRFLRAALGHIDLAALAPKHIAQYRDARTAKTRANREIALLSHALSRAVEWGLLTSNPCRDVRRNKEVPRDRYVTDEELEKFIEEAPEWLAIYVKLKALTGLRQQDLLSLGRANVTNTHIVVSTRKTNKRLQIVLTPELCSLISSLPTQGPFFQTRTGSQLSRSGFASTWQRTMKKYQSRGNAPFREHDIRGKVATDISDPVAAQRLLGHKSIKMTEAYIKARSTDEVQPFRRNK